VQDTRCLLFEEVQLGNFLCVDDSSYAQAKVTRDSFQRQI